MIEGDTLRILYYLLVSGCVVHLAMESASDCVTSVNFGCNF